MPTKIEWGPGKPAQHFKYILTVNVKNNLLYWKIKINDICIDKAKYIYAHILEYKSA